MQKIFTIVLLATTVVFGGLYLSQSPDIQQIEVENPLNAKLEKDLKTAKSKLKQLEIDNEKLKNQLAHFEKVKAEQKKLISTNPETGEKQVEIASDQENPFMKIMNDPKMQDAMKSRRDKMIADRYKHLFAKLDLSDEQKEKLVEIMGERSAAAMASMMKMRMLETEEDKQAAREEREAAEEEADAKIADLLGDQYETYVDYDAKRNEYREVEDLNRRLGDAQLSETQTDQLASIMNETNSTFQFTNESVNESRWAVYSLSEEEKAQYVKELEERDALILKESEAVLSTDQLDALKAEQERDRERVTRSSRGGGGNFGRRGRR